MATLAIDSGGPGPPVSLPLAPCPSLPDDIVMDILARLPAKSAGQCRCLSHAWAAALSSQHFVDRHHRLANRRHSPRVFFLHYSFDDGAQMHMWSQDHHNSNDGTVPHRIHGHALRLVALQCRGLVVLEDSSRDHVNYVCNPSSGHMMALPEGRQKICHKGVSDNHYESLGLGYDDQTKTHKVVRISYHGCDRGGLPTSVGCEVYVVNSAGHWQPIQGKPPAWVIPYEPSVFAQGHVHWLAEKKVPISADTPIDMVIVSFSLADQTFGIVPPPLGMDGESLSRHRLTELDGHLCLFSDYVPNLSCYDIWFLVSEPGAHVVWNLHCRIDMSKVSPDITDRVERCSLYPLAIINNGSRILLVKPGLVLAPLAGNYPCCAHC
ncbi:F-box protein At3g07870 [Brachypodium distachyon]|uniref:F-box domain-containing protein n=1 Tax=Brachypodium distachyon TaxID=15368 RepID=I1GX26_BRADI|nr:F-box protein At3g07870 [Brachypodium distachyon]KQK17557.1 hypothetical protein BRADI_1g35300v3 [Brachypodium distachyon]|eukprot:XP_010229779.2 F-box protein At3g07870 [Brachypodium distachyon]